MAKNQLFSEIIPDLDLLTIEIANNSISELRIDDFPTNWSKYLALTIVSDFILE